MESATEQLKDEIETLTAVYDNHEISIVEIDAQSIQITYTLKLITIYEINIIFTINTQNNKMQLSIMNTTNTMKEVPSKIRNTIKNIIYEQYDQQQADEMPIFQCIAYCNDELVVDEELIKDLKSPNNITFDATSIINDKNSMEHHSNIENNTVDIWDISHRSDRTMNEGKTRKIHKNKRGHKLPTNADYMQFNRPQIIAANSFSGKRAIRPRLQTDINTEMNEYLNQKQPIYHSKWSRYRPRFEKGKRELIQVKVKESHNDIDINQHVDNLKQSAHLYRLKIVMRQYTKYPHKQIHQSVSIILGDFLYLIQHYSKDEEFEIIANELGQCDINNCKILYQHFGQRDHSFGADGLVCEILSKIHCYYQHCYDIGNKLSSKDKEIINKFNETKTDDGHWINKIFLKTNEILWNKRKSVVNINTISHRYAKKFNQLSVNLDANENIDDKNMDEVYVEHVAMFNFGKRFDYSGRNNSKDILVVKPKHSSLKQELISNHIAKITVQQFNLEHDKAQVHFASRYRKQNYKWEKMSIEHVLSLMIYSNYTELQSQFSKTYRNNIDDHSSYYYLGKYLKESTHKFGTSIYKGYPKIFYHGIGELLTFPRYIDDICICCPLSTSTKFEVATNFTNQNNGLIVQFGDFYGYSSSSPKYFALAWLSDYGNENEHLFIQNSPNYKLSIDNIVNASTGCEHKILITALRIIDCAFGASKYGNISVSNQLDALITQIIENQLSNELDSVYESSKYLTDYAKNMINIYCQNKTSMQIILNEKHLSKYNFLQKVFVPDTISIQLQSLYVMFPKIKTIHVKDANNTLDLCKTSIDNHYTAFDSLKIHIHTNSSKIYFDRK
eukprot:256029_1